MTDFPFFIGGFMSKCTCGSDSVGSDIHSRWCDSLVRPPYFEDDEIEDYKWVFKDGDWDIEPIYKNKGDRK